MSTKCTISYSNDKESDYHLYEECFDNDNVYLNLKCLSKISMNLNNDSADAESNSVTLSIPIKVWRMIVEGWTDSSWCKDVSKDNSAIEFNLEGLNELLKNKTKD